jgi:protein RecA
LSEKHSKPKAKAPAKKLFASFLVGELNKALNKKDDTVSSVSTMEAELASDVKYYLPTSFPDLDRILGGGWPVGRVIEISGPEASGKSALTHVALKSAQDQGGLAIIVDWEGALERDKMVKLGIDPANIVFVKPQHAEDGWLIIWTSLEKVMQAPENQRPKFVLVVWDSIAATISKKEAEDTKGEEFSNFEVAKLMAQGVRKAYLVAPKVPACFMFVNQERIVIGGKSGFGGPPKKTPGGDAVKYAATIRVRTAVKQLLKDGTKTTGLLIKAFTKKNKSAPPFQSSDYVVDFTVGPSFAWTAFYELVTARIMKVAGGAVKIASKNTNRDPLDEGVPRGTRYKVPWSEEPFHKTQWIELMKRPDFCEAATAAYMKLIDTRRSGAVVVDEEAVKSVANEDDD